MRTGSDDTGCAWELGRFIGALKRPLGDVERRAGEDLKRRLRAVSDDRLPGTAESDSARIGSVIERHFALVRDRYWAARDTDGLRDKVVDSPEMRALKDDYRASSEDLAAGYATGRQ